MDGGHLSETPCGHSFHFGCLATAMNTSSLCPVCRRPLLPATPVVVVPPPPTRSIRRRNNSRVPLRVISTINTVPGDSAGLGRLSGRDTREARVNRENLEARENRENRENGEPRENREPRAGSPVSEIDIEDFANDNDIRAEILSGLIHSECRQGNISSTRDLLTQNPDLLYSRGDMGDLLTHEAVLSEDDIMLMYIVNDRAVDVNLPNNAHMYPIHYAVVSGSLRMVTILANRGAYLDCVNDSRMTPLMLACESNDSEITQFLLDRGASVRTQDGSGNFPIHVASRAKSYSCVTKLLSAGSGVNVKNHFHDTPLHVSCRLGFHSVSRLLLEEGADPESENKFDYSPLDEASSSGNTRMRNLLCRYINS